MSSNAQTSLTFLGIARACLGATRLVVVRTVAAALWLAAVAFCLSLVVTLGAAAKDAVASSAEPSAGPPDASAAESPLAGGEILGSQAEDQPPAEPAAGGEEAADPFAYGETANNTVLTKDGQPCVPGGGVPLEEGIEACRNVDTRDYQRKDDDGEHALSWDRTYNVYNCHAAYSWGNYNMAPLAAANMEAWNECGSTAGLRAKPAYVWVDSPQWALAEWLFWAPSGGSVVGYNVSFWCRAYYGWGATMMVSYSGSAAAPYAPGYPGQLCYSADGGTMPVGYYWDGYATELNGEYPGIKLSFHCAFAASCSNQAAGTYGMGSWIRNIVVTLRDTVTPTFDSGLYGTLADGQWHSAGTYDTGFYAHDGGGGIQNMRYELDGQTIVNQTYGCDYVQPAPCYEQQVYYWDRINTAGFSDGAHTLTTRVKDLVGNENSFNTTIYTDNSAPSAPDNLSVTPGDWTATDSFSVSFDNPGQGGASPIDGFRYKIGSPPASKTDGTAVDLADGSSSGTVSNLQTGAVGDTPVYVWLYDKAGNTSEVSRATGSLKFDDMAPQEARPDIANGWIGKAEADGYAQTWQLPIEPLPQSGISGYATSLDRDENGDPGITATDPESPREKTLNINEEGSWWFHVRAISGAGVAGSVDTAELKIDLTDPRSQVSGLPGSEWVNHDVTLNLSGSDALSGIDPEFGDKTSGTYFRIADGAWQKGAAIGLSADGMHTVSYHATDVAGNSGGDKSVKVGIDKTAPLVAFAASEDPDRPAVLHAVVSDGLSGIADATISYRRAGTDDSFTPLSTSMSGSTAEAVFPDDEVPAGAYELKISAHDVAGNLAESQARETGAAMVLNAPLRDGTRLQAGFFGKSAKLRSRCPKAKSSRKKKSRKKKSKTKRCSKQAPLLTGLATGVRVRHGKRAEIQGVLTDASDNPIRYATVVVEVRQDVPGSEWEKKAEITSDGNGVFALTLPPGYSRVVRLEYAGTDTRQPASSKDLKLRVQAAVSFKVKPRHVSNGQLMHFKGKIKLDPGAHLPPGGKLVSLEFLDTRGGKRTWKVAGKVLRTDWRGVVRGRYRFRHITFSQRIVFSLNVLKEETFPYVPGRSRPSALAVRR